MVSVAGIATSTALYSSKAETTRSIIGSSINGRTASWKIRFASLYSSSYALMAARLESLLSFPP